MSEETVDGDTETDWSEFSEEFKDDVQKKKPWKVKEPPYEDREQREARRMQNSTEKSLKEEWQEVVKELAKFSEPSDINLLASALKPVIEQIKRQGKPEKYPYSEDKHPYEEKSATALIHKALSKMTLEELQQCQGFPPELLTKRLVQTYNYSPKAQELMSYLIAGKPIPTGLLKSMDARDMQQLEKIVKQRQAQTVQKSDTASISPRLPDWKELHKWKKRATGRA